jgi:hypothetical protein
MSRPSGRLRVDGYACEVLGVAAWFEDDAPLASREADVADVQAPKCPLACVW